MAEVTGFLNGTQVRRIFNVKTMAAKFLSCVAAIGCGMPIGPEGPMVHLGLVFMHALPDFDVKVGKERNIMCMLNIVALCKSINQVLYP